MEVRSTDMSYTYEPNDSIRATTGITGDLEAAQVQPGTIGRILNRHPSYEALWLVEFNGEQYFTTEEQIEAV